MALLKRKKPAPAAVGVSASPTKPKRREQFKQAWRIAVEFDPRLRWMLPLIAVVVLAAFVLLGVLIDRVILTTIMGVLVALIAAMLVFGRRAEAAAYSQIQGQQGAAYAVIENMRGAWTKQPGVAATRSEDVVHRLLGRCGVVLVGEGPAGHERRLPALFTQEKRRLQRLGLEGIPITTIIVGRGEGQVPLPKLQRHITKLPRSVKPAQVTEIDRRLSAMSTQTNPLAGLPKGPLPKNVKMPKMPKSAR